MAEEVLIYCHTLGMHAVNTLMRMCICADSPEPSLLAYA